MIARGNQALAADARSRGLWVTTTLADELRVAAHQTPERPLLIDGDVRLTCRQLHARAGALAAVMADRMPSGSVVSFMLPNWHEAAVVYLAATMAGMVINPITIPAMVAARYTTATMAGMVINPILPSLREA